MAINKIQKNGLNYEIEDARLTSNALTEGTIDKAIGFDANGSLIKGTVSGGSGGTQLYKHSIGFSVTGGAESVPEIYLEFLSTVNEAFTQLSQLMSEVAYGFKVNWSIEGISMCLQPTFIDESENNRLRMMVQFYDDENGSCSLEAFEIYIPRTTGLVDTVTSL